MAECKVERFSLKELSDALTKGTYGNIKIVVPMFQRGKRWDKLNTILMDDLTIWKIRYKYDNLIFPNLPNLLVNFIMDNHLNYLDLILSKYINIKDIIYYLRNKEIHTEYELEQLVIRYIELKHGIIKP